MRPQRPPPSPWQRCPKLDFRHRARHVEDEPCKFLTSLNVRATAKKMRGTVSRKASRYIHMPMISYIVPTYVSRYLESDEQIHI